MTGISTSGGRTFLPVALMAQTLSSMVAGVLTGIVFGVTAGYSAFLGGLAVVVPNAFLVLMLATADISSLMRAAWIGEAGKLVLTGVLLAMLFAFVRPISLPAAIGGLIVAQMTVIVAVLCWRRDA